MQHLSVCLSLSLSLSLSIRPRICVSVQLSVYLLPSFFIFINNARPLFQIAQRKVQLAIGREYGNPVSELPRV